MERIRLVIYWTNLLDGTLALKISNVMIRFSKMDACGNDFIAIGEEDFNAITDRKEFAKTICDREHYIGADGIISPLKVNGYDFGFKYINYLGYDVPFCGHAIRCLTFFSYRLGISTNIEMTVITHVGKRKTIIREIQNNRAFVGLEFENFDIGVRHHVERVEDIDNYPIDKRAMEFFKFSDEHFNVYTEIENGKIKIRTWEYGRDREELSCATGALACALNYNKDKNLSYIQILPRSNKPIYIEIFKDKAILWSYIDVVFEGVLIEKSYI